MKILFVASECVPFCKTGGLADVIAALPKELRKRRHDVRVMLPKYRSIRAQEFGIKETGEEISIRMGDEMQRADIRSARTEKGMRVYFINHDEYFGRPGLYGTPTAEYPDNAERFGFFSRAVLEACKAVEFRPDIIHCNDWQTGLVPYYLKHDYAHDAFFQRTGAVFTIHNIAYQGVFPKTMLEPLRIPWTEFRLDRLEYFDQISFLKAGLAYADWITTVSPTYAREVCGTFEYGRGLEGFLRGRSGHFVGVLNGLDQEEWNPAKDPFLAKPFDIDHLSGRRDCKAALQHSVKLPVRAAAPLVGVVSRFDPQKGIDLLLEILPGLLHSGTQAVVLGQGDLLLQSRLQALERRYPEALRVRTDFNEPLAHHIYGGADIFLMPSRFEPCGLSQLIAMRYGTIPVVADTGGLHDTVSPVVGDNSGTGFVFAPGSAQSFAAAVQEALQLFAEKDLWSLLQRRAMSADFSWDASAQAYFELYRRVLGRQPTHRRSLKPS